MRLAATLLALTCLSVPALAGPYDDMPGGAAPQPPAYAPQPPAYYPQQRPYQGGGGAYAPAPAYPGGGYAQPYPGGVPRRGDVADNYDPQGRFRGSVQREGNIVRHYDRRGRVRRVVERMGRGERRVYDGQGRLIAVTRREGNQVVRYAPDGTPMGSHPLRAARN